MKPSWTCIVRGTLTLSLAPTSCIHLLCCTSRIMCSCAVGYTRLWESPQIFLIYAFLALKSLDLNRFWENVLSEWLGGQLTLEQIFLRAEFTDIFVNVLWLPDEPPLRHLSFFWVFETVHSYQMLPNNSWHHRFNHKVVYFEKCSKLWSDIYSYSVLIFIHINL